MDEERDYILELGGKRIEENTAEDSSAAQGRPYISVLFECCDVYNRVYKNREGTAYVGWCPKCVRKVTVKVGSEGVNCRFFRAK
jgi:hypothetical protein